MNTGWTGKAYTFFDTLAWIAGLNLLWWFFTLLGLGVFGCGPSTLAAHELVRRRLRGDVFPPVRTFWRSYRQNFLKGAVLGVPLLLVGTMLALNWVRFSAIPSLGAQITATLVAVLAVLFTATVCFLFPLHARYELPVLSYFTKASRFALSHLPGSALLLLVTIVIAYASWQLPGIIPFLSIGVWCYLTGWLCEQFFEHNDAAVAATMSGSTAQAPVVEARRG